MPGLEGLGGVCVGGHLQDQLPPFPLTVEVIASSLPELYVEKVLGFLAASLEVTHHLEFYLLWTQKLLLLHGTKLKARLAPPAPVSVRP